MKKVFFILVLAQLSVVVFAQTENTELLREWIYTSEGRYLVSLNYHNERNNGQILANIFHNNLNFVFLDRLSYGQFEVIDNVLNRYQKRAGDIYIVVLVKSYTNLPLSLSVIVEMTSSAEYNCWAFKLK
jgi:hypothetical protein